MNFWANNRTINTVDLFEIKNKNKKDYYQSYDVTAFLESSRKQANIEILWDICHVAIAQIAEIFREDDYFLKSYKRR